MISHFKGIFSKLFKGAVGVSQGATYPKIATSLPLDGWKEVDIDPIEEPLVPLGAFAGDFNNEYNSYSELFTDGMYFGQHDSSPYEEGQLNGALLTSFVRKSVADALLTAQSHLPEGHAFVIWDTYRTLDVQQALFEDYRDQLIDKKDMTVEQATEAAQQYVSIPSTDPTRPSPHNTGASVDLSVVRFEPRDWNDLQELNSIIAAEEDPNKRYLHEMKRMQLYRHATPLDMGTVFDEMSDAVFTRYYEDKLNNGTLNLEENYILANRRMLHDAMSKAGFSNYDEEWFHFDMGNQFDSKRTGKPNAIYGPASLSDENLQHEKMRVNHRIGSEELRMTSFAYNKLGQQVPSSDPLINLVRNAAQATGKASSTPTHPQGSKLIVYPS